jgi:hypothetical protein
MDATKLRLGRSLLRLHHDERGLEPLSVVVITVFTVLVLLFVRLVIWPKIKTMAEQHENELRSLP